MKLTIEQQKLVEDNHNLIYFIINKYDLENDEYYDLLALSLCKAALTYKQEVAKFSTYAITIMLKDIKRDKRYWSRHKRNRNEVSFINLDDTIYESDETYESIIPDFNANKGFSETEIKILLKEFAPKLTTFEKDILIRLLKGETPNTIKDVYGCSRQYIYLIRKNIEKKYLKFIK